MATQTKTALSKSSLNLDSIQESVASFGESMRSVKKSTIEVNKTIQESSKQKKKAMLIDQRNFFNRRSAVRRKEAEGVIEAGSVGGAIKRAGSIIGESTKGFLGRVLDFFGIVLLGWLTNHLPIIIKTVTILMQKMQKIVNILYGFIVSMRNLFEGVFNILTGAVHNLLTFDFADSESRVKDGFDQVMSSFSGLDRVIGDIENLFTTWSIEQPEQTAPEGGGGDGGGDQPLEEEKPQGFMRGLAGVADFATFGLTDFDKRGDLFKGEDQQTQSGVVGQGIDGQDIILNPTAAGAWENARKAAEQDGINLNEQVTSSFRSAAKQQELIDRHAAGDPNVFMPAPVGQSPHQQGWSVDINANSKANEWMRNRGSEFGFEWHGAEDPVHFDYMGPSPGGNDYWIQPGRRHWIPGSGESSISKDKDQKPQGLMRGLAGFADWATFGMTDLDKRGDLFESKPTPTGMEISQAGDIESQEGQIITIPIPLPQSPPQQSTQIASSGGTQMSSMGITKGQDTDLFKKIVLANLQYT